MRAEAETSRAPAIEDEGTPGSTVPVTLELAPSVDDRYAFDDGRQDLRRLIAAEPCGPSVMIDLVLFFAARTRP